MGAPVDPVRFDLRPPTDARLEPLVEAVLGDPAQSHRVQQWTAGCGVSARTLSRLFTTQTGHSYAAWRARARLRAAIRLLAEGRTVAAVTRRLGYTDAGSFINSFQRALGTSPGAYFQARTLTSVL